MLLNRRQWLLGAGGLVVAGAALPRSMPATRLQSEVVAFGGPAFGSYWRIVVPSGTDRLGMRRVIETAIEAINQGMSPFLPLSEISRFNAGRSTQPVEVSRPLHSVICESLRVARLSGGAFDPTAGPLVNRYGFGPIEGDNEARFSDVIVGDGTIRKNRPGLTLDLCGIAKGHALDQISATLGMLGVTDFVAELGGEVFARGRHPQGRPWRIAIEAPVPGGQLVRRVVRLEGQALATSGDAANSYTFAGRRYGHIMDRRRSVPADGRIASVTVVARTAMRADALATALIALGQAEGLAFATRHNIPALFLLREGDSIREVAVAGMRDLICI